VFDGQTESTLSLKPLTVVVDTNMVVMTGAPVPFLLYYFA